MFNKFGHSFIQNYLPEGVTLEQVSKDKAWHWPVSCRDTAIHLDRAIHGEALAGRATELDGIFLDLSSARRGFLPEMFVEYMHGFDIDLKRDLIQIQNHHHTSNGGVRVDTDCQTKIRGLFAAGETMGYQGADRLGGTMLGGSQVFGWRAGAKAAEVAKERPDFRVDRSKIDHLLFEPIARFKEARGTKRPLAMRPRVQNEMWRELLVEKDEPSLRSALQFVEDERDRMRTELAITEPLDLAEAIEHRNLLDVAEAIISAARARTESRGSHYRGDHPKRDDAGWLTNLFITKSEGRLKLEKKWVCEGLGWVDQPGDVRILPWG